MVPLLLLPHFMFMLVMFFEVEETLKTEGIAAENVVFTAKVPDPRGHVRNPVSRPFFDFFIRHR